MTISEMRREYHRVVCSEILGVGPSGPNIADIGSRASVAIARELVAILGYPVCPAPPKIQTIGGIFERRTLEFLQRTFELLQHLRPGTWAYSVHGRISDFDQYHYLAALKTAASKYPELANLLGRDYLIIPDIVIARQPVPDSEINRQAPLLEGDSDVASLTPLRRRNHPQPQPILHATVSCKWTLRSDRAQQIRMEGINLIRMRKGRTPHIVAVAAEPLPSRIASLALGTGDLDCVYHFALPELQAAVQRTNNEDQAAVLTELVELRRLRDISDLPFDLAI